MAKDGKKAIREIPVIIKIEPHSWDYSEFDIKVVPMEYDDGEMFTKTQTESIGKQIMEKISNMKFVVLKSIRCPNCGKQIDEEEIGQYICPECKCKVKMEFS